MALSIDWATGVITVPRADLPVVQVAPEVRELDLYDFRLQLKDLEDDEGICYPDTHRHNTEVLLGTMTLARVIEIINGYTITFEDGSYAVNVVGGNSNVLDVTNFNSVSVRANNSAGMVVTSGGSALTRTEHDKLMAIPSVTLLTDERDQLMAIPTTAAPTTGEVADAVLEAAVSGRPAGSLGAVVAGVGTGTAALQGAVATVDGKVTTVDGVVDAIKTQTDRLPGAIGRARAIAHFHVLLVSNADHRTPAPALTPTVTLAKDGTGFVALAGAVNEIGSGIYDLSMTASETDCESGTLCVAADGADTRYISFVTSP